MPLHKRSDISRCQMTAADPTYPLYPVACLLATALLLLVLLMSFLRQSLNIGVAFLCFWLSCETLTSGVNAIIWSNNADVKLYVYCDIVSHVQIITFVVKPMATLVITRRLYLISSLQSVELFSKAEKHRNCAMEWSLGLAIPVLVAGPLYYVVQYHRFDVFEAFGCRDAVGATILGILLIFSWTVIPPLISVTIYYPRVARELYLHKREIDQFLQSNGSVSSTHYYRTLAIASLDVILTLPIGITTIALGVMQSMAGSTPPSDFLLRVDWSFLHSDWEPAGYSYATILAQGTVAQTYFSQWSSVVLAFVIFAAFGTTADARASYWRAIRMVGSWCGWKSAARIRRAGSALGLPIKFAERPRAQSLNLEIDPSFIISAHEPIRDAENIGEHEDRDQSASVRRDNPDANEENIRNIEHGTVAPDSDTNISSHASGMV